ncbi:MAG: alkyl hydroperoxide reductase subunit F [Austwickia sp.]|nr:alkyl hydroperoxide reductase subunit F [Austwickia sp.]
MLDSNLTAQLTTYLERVMTPIQLIASLDDGPKSAELAELLQQIAGLSDQVSYERRDDDARRPSFTIARAGSDVEVRFAGIPLGHEFTSLVLALLQVGGVAPKISDTLADQIRAIEGEHVFETYMSLTCQNCPDVVQALNAMSVLNPRIRHTAIEGGAFQDEIAERKILAVPTVYHNGELFGQGRMTIEEIVATVDTGASARDVDRLNAMEPFDVLIVGGGPAGAAAAVYAARKGIRTGLVAERFGGQVMDTMAIENFVSVPYTEGPRLSAALEEHVTQYGVEIVKAQRVCALTAAGDDGLTVVQTESGARLSGRTVILAPGARWRAMGVPGEQDYRNKGVTFCPHCDGPLFKGKRVAVIGGGNSGIEAAIDLAGVVGHVTVLEFLDELKADAVLQRKLRSLPNVDVVLSAQTTEVVGDGDRVTGLSYQDRVSGQGHTLDLEGIFVQIGLLPNTEWLRGSLELSDRGEIVIDDRGHTSLPGVFAAGDATTVPYKQIVIAMGAGSTAALSAFDHLIRTSAPAEAST